MTTRPQITKTPHLISRKDASNILGVSEKTVTRYQASGKLSPIMLTSRTIRYHLHDVEKLIRDSEVALRS